MRVWIDRVLIGAGTLALLVAVTLVVAPDVMSPLLEPSELEEILSGIAGLVAIGSAILLGCVIALWKGALAPRQEVDTLLADDEDDLSTMCGFDETLQTAVETGDQAHQEEIRETLRDVAIETVAAAEKRSASTVREEILSGGWTDDPVVAAFLGGIDAADAPVRWRLYAWLHGTRAFEESVERSLVAIEEYGDGRDRE